MRKRFDQLFPFLFLFSELIVLCVCFVMIFHLKKDHWGDFGTFINHLFVGNIIWLIIGLATRSFKSKRQSTYSETLKSSLYNSFIFISVFFFTLFILRIDTYSRNVIIVLISSIFLSNTLLRLTIHATLARYRELGYNFRRAVIIGFDELGVRLFSLLKRKKSYGIRCEGFYSNDKVNGSNEEILGTLDDFFKSDLDNLDYIYVSEKVSRYKINRIVDLADSRLIKVKLIPSVDLDSLKIFSFRKYEGMPIVDINDLPLDSLVNRVVKRAFDIVFSTIVIVTIISWLFPIVALIIKIESRGPVVFKQERNGKNNKTFWCYKFRSMILNNEADSKWASKNDSRVTRFGMFLRKTSLDEFPQFFNVIKGDMSIVGPRPHAIAMNESYQNRVQKFLQRHSSKPGVTGLAQAKGYRGEIECFYQMSSRVRLDRFYLQNWSFFLDVKIIFQTIISVVKDRGNAY
ncbi:undecaprenyl-phosphate glucose phosphotransferase [Roseivirga misakiensis]|uniref:Undecaprenyl-phosphate glucose phosphotransferase n=1 Tax=Roseivirga misakiensis TaxID=1563681 RepID=A0A1E5T5W3_9BACT|nr:undecaprenyl-phosphate glucose phosphotransferase [Roseivirga misakiensis]OEK06750.1 undecaprenyl-phosphate glucose phosphotransferase [Roseivirga misakiensis]